MTQKIFLAGPVSLSERVKRSLYADKHLGDAEAAVLLGDVVHRLSRVYRDSEATHAPVLVPGPGVAAVEAMLGTLVPRDGNVLVVANGARGERAAEVLEAQGKRHTVARSHWLEPLDLASAGRLLSSGAFSHAFAVQHDPVSGRLNDVPSLAKLCSKMHVPLLIDAEVGFGALPLDMASGVVAAAAPVDRCLHGPPGLSFVLAPRDALADGKKSGATGVLLDLCKLHREQRAGAAPWLATSLLAAAAEALCELDEQGGAPSRLARYRALGAPLLDGLAPVGFEPLLPSRHDLGPSLIAYKLPKRLTFERARSLLAELGLVIGPVPGMPASLRLGLMGDLAEADVARLVAALTALH